MTHAGNSYRSDDPQRIAEIAEAERTTVVDAARALVQAEIPCDIISVGSTPTFLFAKSFGDLTEVRAGAFALSKDFRANTFPGMAMYLIR